VLFTGQKPIFALLENRRCDLEVIAEAKHICLNFSFFFPEHVKVVLRLHLEVVFPDDLGGLYRNVRSSSSERRFSAPDVIDLLLILVNIAHLDLSGAHGRDQGVCGVAEETKTTQNKVFDWSKWTI